VSVFGEPQFNTLWNEKTWTMVWSKEVFPSS